MTIAPSVPARPRAPRTNYLAYQEMPYEGCAHGDSHPTRIWAIAVLLGLDPPDPRTCRVLEVGCARGGNILPMAAVLPDARFCGVDISDGQIEKASAMRDALKLDNVELRVADVAALDDLGTFDYILAHGVYSWIAPESRAALRALCGQHLAPDGLAYISHNVYPGWHRREAVRQMMLYHLGDMEGAKERVDAAREVLGFVTNASSPEDPAYKFGLNEELEKLSRSRDYYVFHEHIAVHNAPSYLHEFVAEFEAEGLHYVADGYLPANFGRLLPEQLAHDLDRLVGGERLHFEQYQDFLLNRAFRKSLLSPKPPAADRLHPERWMEAHAMSACELTGEPRSWRKGEHVMQDVHPATDALLARLAERWPGTVPVAELFEAHAASGLDPSPSGSAPEAFCYDLFLLAMNEVIEVSPVPITIEAPGPRPSTFPWVAAELDAGLLRLTTVHHKTAAPPRPLRILASLADGTRDREALIDGMLEAVEEGRLSVPVEDPTPRELRAGIAEGIDRGLARLRHLGLLR